MRGMLVHVGLSRVLVGPCWWTVLGGVVSVVYFWVGIGKIALPVCSLTRMTGTILWWISGVTIVLY